MNGMFLAGIDFGEPSIKKHNTSLYHLMPEPTSQTINGALKIHNTPVVDYVVEQGVSGVWSYRKWASGLAECWGSFSTQSGAWNGTNNVYYMTKTFPLLSGFFVSAPKVMATVNSCRYIVVPTVIVPTTTECVVTFMHFYGGIEDVAMGMLIYANGQWK